MIDKSTIDRIFAAADIVEVVSDFITLKKKGTNFTACCPFHQEKTPSFMVSPAKGVFKCFGCGKGGGAINFVMEHEKLTYPEALRWVGRKYGIEVETRTVTDLEQQRNNDQQSMFVVNSWADSFFASQLRDTAAGRDIGLSYFKERGFTDATIELFSLGYCPESGSRNAMSLAAIADGYQERFLISTGLTILREQDGSYYDRFAGRVIFPIHSLTGRVIGFGGRTMREDKKTAKYLNSPQSEIYDKSHTLYGIFQAKKAITQADKCILVEGYTDVMQMHQSGIQNVVASSGTSLTDQQVRLISRFTKNVTVIYDGDMAGIKASLRGIDMILGAGLNVRVVPLPEGADPDSFARSRSATELVAYIERSEEDFLRFKTRILLEGSAGDPIERAGLINQIVSSIAVIPDQIVREVYIKECSIELDVDRETLSRAVVSAMLSFHTPRSVSQGQPQQHSRDGGQGSASLVESPVKVEVSGGSSSLVLLERELINYLIKYGSEQFEFELSGDNVVMLSVGRTIIDELRNDLIEMTDPVCALIFGLMADGLDRGTFPTTDELLGLPDQAIGRFVADIMADDELNVASAIWARYDMAPKSERQMLSVAVPKAVVIYKSKVIEAKVRGLQQALMADVDAFDEQIIGQIKQLLEAKGAMQDRYKRLQ